MKYFSLFALALVSLPAFACYGPGPCESSTDRQVGPARGVYDIGRSGCEGVHAAVYSAGALIVYYGPDLYTRVVRDHSFCSNDQILQPFWGGGCYLGYVCSGSSGY